MTQINERESEMVSAQKVSIFAVIANEQGTELIDPGKATFRGEALFVNGRVEQAFPSAFGRFAVAFVLSNVGNDLVIETNLARIHGIKGTVGVEIRSGDGQAQAFHVLEGRLQVRFEVEGVMMVARHDPGRSDHVALSVGDGQNIGSFGPLALLVGDTFAAFLGYRVRAIEVQLRQIEGVLNDLNALFPDPLQTAIGTPLLEVIVDCLPTQLFFSGSLRDAAIGNCVH